MEREGGSSLIIHRQQASLFFERQKHILNSSWALKVYYLKGISLKSTLTRISMNVKVKTELTLHNLGNGKLREVGLGGGGGGGSLKRGHTVPPGSAWLVKHSCHFVHLEVGLLTQVEKWKGEGREV